MLRTDVTPYLEKVARDPEASGFRYGTYTALRRADDLGDFALGGAGLASIGALGKAVATKNMSSLKAVPYMLAGGIAMKGLGATGRILANNVVDPNFEPMSGQRSLYGRNYADHDSWMPATFRGHSY